MDVVLSPWVTLPVIGAFIGWFTNYLAVKMLFHPREPRRFLGLTIQGVFPRRQAVVAEKLGAVVAEQLITSEEIAQRLASPSARERVRASVLQFLDVAIRERLPAAVPMVAMFLSPQLIETVKGAFSADLDKFIDSSLSEVTTSLTNDLDIREMVRSKVAAFSSDRLEELLVAIMKKEFRFIEVIGGVLGALIGLVQVVLV
jgi:uncharacterized membrane protein YheB (UPF0754 family)